MDTFDGMRTFASVARHGYFTLAAKQLGISTKLASKYVRQLEERLGAQLFHRTTRSVSLTETGKTYFEGCGPLLDQLDELEAHVQERQKELAGSVRITAPTGFGSSHLIDALIPFQREHPKVTIDLHLSDRNISMIDEGMDLAIRFGELEDSSLIARKLMGMRRVIFASPEYLRNHGYPESPVALTTHNCLCRPTESGSTHWHVKTEGGLTTVRVSGSFQANSPRALVNMAAGGLGIGLGPLYAAQPFLEDGSLELLFEADEVGLYAVYPPSRILTARIRALIDHLALTFEPNTNSRTTEPI